MNNDNDSRFEKNHGTHEPYLKDTEIVHNYPNYGNSKKVNLLHNHNDNLPNNSNTPPAHLNEAPTLPYDDYDNHYQSDSERDYDDLKADFEQAIEDEKIILIQSSDTTVRHLLNKHGHDYEKVARIISEKDGYNHIVCKRYLGDSVLKSSKKVKFLIVKSGMGTGKTTAMKKVIASLGKNACILFISPRKKLNLAIARDLGLSYYEDVKNETDKEKQAVMARRMAITPQSLGAILKAHPEIKYEYVVLDESQAVTKALEASITKDKLDTVNALKQACKLANHVIAMDAFAGTLTSGLVKELAGDEDIGYLINTKKTWDIDADLIIGGKFKDRVKAANARQIEYINAGKTIYIASSSATYCDSREDVLKDRYKHLQILNITSKSTKEAEVILSDPDSIKNWDVVIGSPSIAVGVSFDIENHIDEVFGVFANNQGTGDSEDSRQSMARPRKPVARHWTIVLDDDRKVFNHVPRCPDDIAKAIGDRLARAFFAGGVAPVAITDDEASVLRIVSMCQHERIRDKNNFNNIFLDSLVNDLGVTINEINIDSVEANEEDEAKTEEQKEQVKLREIEIKTTSEKIDEIEANKIRALIKFGHSVTDKQKNSHERFKFESKFNIDCDKLDESELKVYLKHDDKSTISKLIAREQLFAQKDFDKEYMKSRVVGRGEDLAFKVDMFSEKLNYPLFKSILKYATPYIEGKEYSDSSLKKEQSFIRFIKKNYKEITALNVIALQKKWHLKPASLMNHLLDEMGYSHKSKRIRGNGKKRLYVYSVDTVDSVEALFLRRKSEGKDWITSTKNLMEIYEKFKVEKAGISDTELVECLYKDAAEMGW